MKSLIQGFLTGMRGSGPCSGTEAGDLSPVFAALEHSAGDFTALGKDPCMGFKSSDTVIPYILPFAGMADRHPRAGCRQRRAIGVPSVLLLFDQGFRSRSSLLLW